MTSPVKSLCLLGLLLLLGLPAIHAQEEKPYKRPAPALVVHTHPFNLLDPNKPAVRLGLEVKLSELYWVDVDAGYSPFERSGWRVRGELKQRFIHRSYFSAGLFHHNYRYTDIPTL